MRTVPIFSHLFPPPWRREDDGEGDQFRGWCGLPAFLACEAELEDGLKLTVWLNPVSLQDRLALKGARDDGDGFFYRDNFALNGFGWLRSREIL